MLAMENNQEQFTIINNHTYSVDIWYRPQNSPQFIMVRSVSASKSVQLPAVENNQVTVSAKNIKDRIITLESPDKPLILLDIGEYNQSKTKVNFTTDKSGCRQQ